MPLQHNHLLAALGHQETRVMIVFRPVTIAGSLPYANVATAQGSNHASSDTVESEGQQMKQF